MISSKSVSSCNRFHARWANSGKITISKGGRVPLFDALVRNCKLYAIIWWRPGVSISPGLGSVPGRDTWTDGQTDGRSDRIPVANTRSQQYLPVQLWRVKTEWRRFCMTRRQQWRSITMQYCTHGCRISSRERWNAVRHRPGGSERARMSLARPVTTECCHWPCDSCTWCRAGRRAPSTAACEDPSTPPTTSRCRTVRGCLWCSSLARASATCAASTRTSSYPPARQNLAITNMCAASVQLRRHASRSKNC